MIDTITLYGHDLSLLKRNKNRWQTWKITILVLSDTNDTIGPSYSTKLQSGEQHMES